VLPRIEETVNLYRRSVLAIIISSIDGTNVDNEVENVGTALGSVSKTVEPRDNLACRSRIDDGTRREQAEFVEEGERIGTRLMDGYDNSATPTSQR
jgi:hypothetical protein